MTANTAQLGKPRHHYHHHHAWKIQHVSANNIVDIFDFCKELSHYLCYCFPSNKPLFWFLGKEPSEEELQSMFSSLGIADGQPPHHPINMSIPWAIIKFEVIFRKITIIIIRWGSWHGRAAGRFDQPDADDGGNDAEPPLQGSPLPSHERDGRES